MRTNRTWTFLRKRQSLNSDHNRNHAASRINLFRSLCRNAQRNSSSSEVSQLPRSQACVDLQASLLEPPSVPALLLLFLPV